AAYRTHPIPPVELIGGYCARTLTVFENRRRPDGAPLPPGGSSYFPLFISFASAVPYINAAVIGYSPGVEGAFSTWDPRAVAYMSLAGSEAVSYPRMTFRLVCCLLPRRSSHLLCGLPSGPITSGALVMNQPVP